jgi:hypothetical protein
MLKAHAPLFRKGLGSFNDGIQMPIPFKDNADLSTLKQQPYSLSERDLAAIDDILNPLRVAGVVEEVPLGQPSIVASPAFVV